MSMQVRPGYTNPLMTRNDTAQRFLNFGKNQTGKTADLQAKQQQLQNTLLLLKSTGTDCGASNAEQQEQVQKALEQVSDELQAVKNDVVYAATSVSTETAQRPTDSPFSEPGPRMDTYEKQTGEMASPGIYQLLRGESSGYRISFVPYTE